MFRILQLQKSIRRLTSVTNNVARIKANQQPVRFYSSALAALKEETQAPLRTTSVQNVLVEIQNNLKEYGRISNRQVLNLSDSISRTDRVNSTQALAAIRCFTDLSVDMKPENRIKNVDALWQRLVKLCVHLEVGHYNALLRAYLDSEHEFNPIDFLGKMAENGVGPNRITYQFLVERYCQIGDVSGASRIMRFMEEKEVPITQNIINLMIMGHARNNDIASAEEVFNVMKAKNITPDESSYGLLLSEYARKGDIDRIVSFFKDEKNRDIFLDSRSVSNIIYQLVSNGYQESVHKVLETAPAIIKSEFHRLVHRLASGGHLEACVPLLNEAKNYPQDFVERLSIFLVGQHASKAKSTEEVVKMISAVPKSDPSMLYMVALRSILVQGDSKSAVDLVSTMQKDGIDIRTHMYFPLVSQLAQKNDIKELANVIVSLRGKASRIDVYTLYKILKAAGWKTQPAIDALLPLRKYGTAVKDCLVSALNQRHSNDALELASQPLRTVVCATNSLLSGGVMRRYPDDAFVDISSCIIARGLRSTVDEDSESDADAAEPESAEPASAESNLEDVELEDGKTSAVPYAKLMQMSPQDLTDHIVTGLVQNYYIRDKCTRILNIFKERKLGISQEIADKLIENCKSDEVKEAVQRLASTKFVAPDRTHKMTKIEARSDILEEYLKREELSNPPFKNLLTNKLVIALCCENDIRAVEVLRQLGDQVLPTALDAFIRFACNSGDTSLGLECWSKYSTKRSATMHFVNLAINLIKEGKIGDAVDIINAKKEAIAHRPHFKAIQNLLIILSTSTDERCQNLLNELRTSGSDRSLYLGHLNMLINNGQLVEAVDLFENSISKYGRYGLRSLGIVLVEKEKYELLQRLQNILTANFGEEESLFELSLVLLKCRKVRQAKRIVELSGQPSRVVARVLLEGDLASLESLVEVLPTFHQRRDQVCEKLMEVYDKSNNAESALALYTRFEEEKYIPTNKFLFGLKNLLSRSGYEIPFDSSVLSDESFRVGSSSAESKSEQKRSAPVKAPEVNRSEAEIEADIINSVDKNRAVFKKALRDLEATKKNALVDKLAVTAIREKNFEKLAFVVPEMQRVRVSIFLRILDDDSLHKNYVEVMEAHVQEMSDMLKAYWFHHFLKGDEKKCEDLWAQHTMYSMIYVPKFNFDLLRGHEERYYSLLDKIQIPGENKVGAFVGLVKSKIADSASAGIEILEKEAKMITHVNGPTLQKIRKQLIDSYASDEILAKFDALVQKHGINVTPAPA